MKETIKYILTFEPKLPINLLKDSRYIDYYIYKFKYNNKDIYIIKYKKGSIENLNFFNNTKIIDEKILNFNEEYFFLSNIIQYFIFGKKITKFSINNWNDKIIKYNLLDKLVLKYFENLKKIFKDIKYYDITDEINFYFYKKEEIQNRLNILKKIKLDKTAFYKKLEEKIKNVEKNKKYLAIKKILDNLKNDEKYKPIITEYLDSNLDFSVYYTNKEKYHKIFKFYSINKNIIDYFDYIFAKGYIITNFSLYLYFLETLIVNKFLEYRKINLYKMQKSLNELILLDKKERLVVKFNELFTDSLILNSLTDLYNIYNNDYILWHNIFISAIRINLRIDDETDKKIKDIFKSWWQITKIIPDDYLKNKFDIWKYELNSIDFYKTPRFIL